MPSPRRVFISYSRKDGNHIAHALRDLLSQTGCAAWLDTKEIHGGSSWSKDIEAALNNCEILVAVLTDESYISEICRAEQIWALDNGKLVIPVLAAADVRVPLWLYGRQWRKYPEQSAELLADLDTNLAPAPPPPRPPRYDTIPSLPQNFVPREHALAGLRNLVFEAAGANIAVTALAGMGGIGKTMLAIALCRDPAVQRAFPDGIAWITIGREWDGDFVTRMREVAKALGDDLSAYDNPLACESRYRTILRDKAALVVIDDIWNLEHLKSLLVDAPRSRFLFTTRDTGIAKAVASRRYSANLLSESEGRELLARWADVPVDALPPEADRIIQACGELAAAIAQLGATLREVSSQEWRDTLEALESADISAIEERLPPGQQSFFKSLAVSFDALPQQIQERYLKFAILLEDVPMPLVVLKTLWKINDAEARRTARYFVDRSLASWQDPRQPAGGIRLHDLQLDYVRARFADQAALPLIHGALRLSAHVITRRPEEFASQMIGRLLPYKEIEAIAEFTKDIAEGSPGPWLKPLWQALHPAGTALIRTLVGHSAFVEGVALAGDGRIAVSASYDQTLKVWDLASGREVHTLSGHSDSVFGVKVTADGRHAVSASLDHTRRIWDLESGQQVHTLVGYSDSVFGVAVTAGAQRAVAASQDNQLKVWDLESGREVYTLSGHSGYITAVAVTADGRRAVSASSDHTLKVWYLSNGHEAHTLAGHSGVVWGVVITSGGRRAVSASSDHTLKVWDLSNGHEVHTLAGHSGRIWGVAVTADGHRAVSASRYGQLQVWDLNTGQQVRMFGGQSASLRGLAVTNDGRRAVSAYSDGTLKVWDLDGGEEVRTLRGHSSHVTEVAVTADGQRAVSASGDYTLKIWDLARGWEVRTAHSAAVNGVAVASNGRCAVSASADKTMKVWDLASGLEVRTLGGHSESFSDVAVTADGRCAVSASSNNTLTVWDLGSAREVRILSGHSSHITAVAVTADGRRAVSTSFDKTLKIWDLASGQEVGTLTGHSDSVWEVAVMGDARYAVSASSDHTLKVWDLASGQEIRTLVGHSGQVTGVAVTPDGRRAVSTSWDNTLKVWNLDSGTVMAGFTCDARAISCSFAGPDKILGGDGAGRVFLVKLEMK